MNTNINLSIPNPSSPGNSVNPLDDLLLTHTINREINSSVHYSHAIDSVNIINDLLLNLPLNEEEKNRLKYNIGHLEIMVSENFWSIEDLLPLTEAIAAGKEGCNI